MTQLIFWHLLTSVNSNVKHSIIQSRKKIKHCNKNTIGYIVYNMQHTYCVRVKDGEYWLIDSMKGKPQKLNDLRSMERKGVGVIRLQKI